MRGRIKKIFFMLTVWILFFVVINALCGLIAKNNYMHLDSIDQASARESLGYLIPNQDKTILFPGLKPYHVTINGLGLRSTGLSLTPETLPKYPKRILCLGDSFTFGLFVDDEASFPYQLQEIFARNRQENVAVLNAGIGGTTITDYLYFLKVKGLSLEPDLVIINFAHNDLVEMQKSTPFYERIKDARKPTFFRLFKRTNFMRSFRKIYVNLKYKRWLSKVNDPKAREILTSQSRDIEDVLYASRVYHTSDVVKNPYSEELKEGWKHYFTVLKETIGLLRENNIDILFFTAPHLLSVFEKTNGRHEDVIKDFLDEQGVTFIDLTYRFQEEKDNILKLFNNPPRDFHLSQEGNKILSEEIYNKIKYSFVKD